jgi:hypothetical protein
MLDLLPELKTICRAEQKELGVLKRACERALAPVECLAAFGGVFLQHDMRVDPAEPHRADARAQRLMRRPGLPFV